jgi:hypothetical protein
MKLRILFPAVLLLFAVASCKKKEPESKLTPMTPGSTATHTIIPIAPPVVAGQTYPSIDYVFNMLSVKPKIVAMNAATGGSFYGASGTRYVFKPNSFITASGAAVTGTVQLEVAEYLNKGDMIFSGMLPMSGDEPLLSGGEFSVNATAGGQKVFLKPGSTYEANIPAPGADTAGMQLFYGDPGANATSDKVNWRPATMASVKTYTVPAGDSTPAYTYTATGTPMAIGVPWTTDTFRLMLDSCREVNCDAFGSWPKCDIKIQVTADSALIVPATRVFTYITFDGRKMMMNCERWGRNFHNTYSMDRIAAIPAHIISFALIDGVFYGGMAMLVPSDNVTYSVMLSKADPAALKAQADLLK